MVEYVKVKFPDDGRTVILDGRPGGLTNRMIRTNVGSHRFSLEGEPDFSPESRLCVVEDTTRDNPKIITFDKVPASGSAGAGSADSTSGGAID